MAVSQAAAGTLLVPRIQPDVLNILVCPVPECRGKLDLADNALVCRSCGLRYRMEERWPVLLPEEAQRPSTPAE